MKYANVLFCMLTKQYPDSIYCLFLYDSSCWYESLEENTTVLVEGN